MSQSKSGGRCIFFLVAIILGVVLGLFYGWRINPIEYTDATTEALRVDYKTDYVLMLAEVYSSTSDLVWVKAHSMELGGSSPQDIVTQAVRFAEENGYNETDLSKLRSLMSDLERDQLNTENDSP